MNAILDSPGERVAEVKAGLESICGVDVTHISDPEDQASQLISADVEVVGKGKIGFLGLSSESFEHSSNIRLTRIGDYGFRTREIRSGNQAYGGDMDIGPASAIEAVRRLNITTVQKAIDHYDDLIALIEPWPVITGEWPTDWPVDEDEWNVASNEEIRFIALDGTSVFYCLKKSSSNMASIQNTPRVQDEPSNRR